MHRHPKIDAVSTLVAGACGAAGGARRARRRGDARRRRRPLALDPALSLDPTAPQVGALPGGLTPAYGQKLAQRRRMALRLPRLPHRAARRRHRRPARCPQPDPVRASHVLHTPPVVPDDLETFSHTGVVPTTYAQLNFSEGNSIVTGNVSILARQANVSTSFLEPASQLGITDVFRQHPAADCSGCAREVLVGAFTQPLRLDRRVRRGPLRHAAHRPHQRRRASRSRCAPPVGSCVLHGRGRPGRADQQGGRRGHARRLERLRRTRTRARSFVAHGHLGAAYGRRVAGRAALPARLEPGRSRQQRRQRRASTPAPDATLDIFAADLRLDAGPLRPPLRGRRRTPTPSTSRR